MLPGAAAAADGDDVVATITDQRVTESSGLVQSTRDDALAYTVNDSGSAPVVYVVELASGDVVGTATLRHAGLVDTEALAIGADQRLYVADIGDNEGLRRHVDLYAIDQPGRGDVTVPAVRHRVRYNDGPRDAESLVSDAVDGSFYIVSKGLLGGGLYRLDSLRPGGVTAARPVEGVAVPGLATDAGALGDRGGAVVRTYSHAYVFAVPGWELLGSVELPEQRQGETVAVIDGGPAIYVGTEGLPSDLVHVTLPADAWRQLGGHLQQARQEHRERREPGRIDDEMATDDVWTPRLLAGSGVLLLLLGGIVGQVVRRRRSA
jgi:hypothetical protein